MRWAPQLGGVWQSTTDGKRAHCTSAQSHPERDREQLLSQGQGLRPKGRQATSKRPLTLLPRLPPVLAALSRAPRQSQLGLLA